MACTIKLWASLGGRKSGPTYCIPLLIPAPIDSANNSDTTLEISVDSSPIRLLSELVEFMWQKRAKVRAVAGLSGEEKPRVAR